MINYEFFLQNSLISSRFYPYYIIRNELKISKENLYISFNHDLLKTKKLLFYVDSIV